MNQSIKLIAHELLWQLALRSICIIRIRHHFILVVNQMLAILRIVGFVVFCYISVIRLKVRLLWIFLSDLRMLFRGIIISKLWIFLGGTLLILLIVELRIKLVMSLLSFMLWGLHLNRQISIKLLILFIFINKICTFELVLVFILVLSIFAFPP